MVCYVIFMSLVYRQNDVYVNARAMNMCFSSHINHSKTKLDLSIISTLWLKWPNNTSFLVNFYSTLCHFVLKFSGMIHIPFLAFLFVHHLPSLCSCPIPATRRCPSLPNCRLFTKPGYKDNSTTLSLNSRPVFHKATRVIIVRSAPHNVRI